MSTIWKYTLAVQDQQMVSMPVGARVLSVQMQMGALTMWAVVDPARARCNRVINIYGTGNPIDGAPYGRYVGTVQMTTAGTLHLGAPLVWHVFVEGVEDSL